MRLPNLVIVGMGKAGTTSLFWYLSQHPDICASREKEIRYFAALTEGGDKLPPVEDYARHFRYCVGERYALEASPQYFHGGRRVAEAMASLLDDPRVVVMFRDPVDRLWSQFRFVKTRFGPVPDDMSFDEYVESNERVWREGRPLTPETVAYWHLTGSMYADHIQPWFDVFGDAFRVTFFEDLVDRPKDVVLDLAGWLGVDREPVDGFSFSVENKTVPIRSTALQRMALFLNREDLLGRHRRLKAPLRRAYYTINRRRRDDEMSAATAAHLRSLVAPANERLAEMLIDRGYEQLPAWLRTPAPASS
jgi:hypothetical protein